MWNKIRSNKGISLILAAFVILGLTYSVVNPLYEATDELRHYRFVRVIATTGHLPVQGQEPCRSQSHHPPLFYALGAMETFWIHTGRDVCFNPPENPFWNYRYWDVGVDNKNQYLHGADEAFPWYGDALAAHLVRGMNVLIGMGVVWLTWAIFRAAWPYKKKTALGAGALVAFNPMFLYMAGAINNDVIAALSGAAVLYGCVRLLRSAEGLTWRWGVAMGGLYGLALMSKFNLAAVLLIIEITLTWIAWQRRQWRQWVTANVMLVVVTAAIAGWWFVRNQLLYGEPTGFVEVTQLWGVRNPLESFGLAFSELPYAWTTLWGRFGFGQIPMPQIIYDGLLWLTTAGFVGAIIGFVRRGLARFFLFLLALDVALFLAVLFNYMLVSPAGPNGRFFFPGLAALAVLIAYGLGEAAEIFT
ncbi:MAG: phospholipid carrier-dependent glycosyltransferase, partial [Candidatus Promineifilaceae bacterium]